MLMHERIVEKVDEIEDEWDRPIGERLLKVLVIAAATALSGMLIEWAYDKTRDHFQSTDDNAVPELN
jgi:hypothetical protein